MLLITVMPGEPAEPSHAPAPGSEFWDFVPTQVAFVHLDVTQLPPCREHQTPESHGDSGGSLCSPECHYTVLTACVAVVPAVVLKRSVCGRGSLLAFWGKSCALSCLFKMAAPLVPSDGLP